MGTPILFTPDNRSLGSATGDFGLYGGQAEPQTSIREAHDEGVSAGPDEATLRTIARGDASANLVEDLHPISQASFSGGASGESIVPAPFLISGPEMSFHSGVLAPLADGAAQIDSDWSPAAPGAEATLPSVQSAESSHTENLAQSDMPLAGTVAEVLTGTTVNLLDDLAAPVTGLPPITETVGETLSITTGAVDDTLEGLAGGDPLGGVATLVNLLSISDMFDLNPVDAPIVDAAGDSELGMLDTLACDILPDALLGTHTDDGLLGNTHLDHPLGL